MLTCAFYAFVQLFVQTEYKLAWWCHFK